MRRRGLRGTWSWRGCGFRGRGGKKRGKEEGIKGVVWVVRAEDEDKGTRGQGGGVSVRRWTGYIL